MRLPDGGVGALWGQHDSMSTEFQGISEFKNLIPLIVRREGRRGCFIVLRRRGRSRGVCIRFHCRLDCVVSAVCWCLRGFGALRFRYDAERGAVQAQPALFDAVAEVAFLTGIDQGSVPKAGHMLQGFFESGGEVSRLRVVRSHLFLEG